MSEIIFWTHSGVRYLVLLAGVVTVVFCALAVSEPASRRLRLVWRFFVGLLDTQVLIGIVVLIVRPFEGQYVGHLVMMLTALLVAHGTGAVFRRRDPQKQTGRVLLTGALVALLLIVGGIMAIGRSVV